MLNYNYSSIIQVLVRNLTVEKQKLQREFQVTKENEAYLKLKLNATQNSFCNKIDSTGDQVNAIRKIMRASFLAYMKKSLRQKIMLCTMFLKMKEASESYKNEVKNMKIKFNNCESKLKSYMTVCQELQGFIEVLSDSHPDVKESFFLDLFNKYLRLLQENMAFKEKLVEYPVSSIKRPKSV